MLTPRCSLGPVSSLHDRACELFYSLLGGIGMFDPISIGYFLVQVVTVHQSITARFMLEPTTICVMVERYRMPYTLSGL
jgi:hypothetical protein